ncbi:DUF5052 family protein [Lactobacillus delbrueckii]|uniref:DUF5052 family protein n=1 Tax=Lactobacillus delbrueckii TaxID=1584 RepID=UPI0009B599DF|nr:DUF5052 family protein [Lactobacillus delbrueckii]
MKGREKMKKKRLLAACLALALLPLLSSCSMISDYTLDLKSKLVGIPFTVSTYDYDGQKIDQIKGKSVYIETYKPMSKENSSGDEQSKVIDVEFGGQQMIHVGSSLIANEGLHNYEDTFSKKVTITDKQRSIPVLSIMYNNFRNDWLSKGKVIMIRSQAGKPIAVYAGNKVRVSATDMPSTTQINVDGHRLFIYRCDYSIYDMETIKKM